MKKHILARYIALLASLATLQSAHATNAILTDDMLISAVSNTVTQLDCITGQLIDTSPVGNSPLGLCFDGTAVWVANKTSNNLLRR